MLTETGEVDSTVYRDRDTEQMFINFAVASAQLGQVRAMEKNYDEAIRRMEMALRLDPTLKAGKILLGTYFMMSGRDQKAIEHYIAAIREEPTEAEYWLRLARIYEFKDQLPFALQNLNEGIRLAPDARQLYIDGFRVAARSGNAAAAKDFLRQWLGRHSDDQEMRNIFDNADKLLEEEFGLAPGGAAGASKDVP